MPAPAGYTFSKKRLALYIVAVLFTYGTALLVILPWEWYRYVNAN